jgi:hypothetical protein
VLSLDVAEVPVERRSGELHVALVRELHDDDGASQEA